MTGSDTFAGCTGCATGGAGGGVFVGINTAAGGRATDCGVMKRGAGFGSGAADGAAWATGAAGANAAGGWATTGGLAGAVAGGAIAWRGACEATGAAERAGTGVCAFCVMAFNTS